MNPSLRLASAFGLAGLLALTAPAGLQAADPVGASPDQGFVTNATEAGLAQIDYGRMAAANADDADVRAFGQKMVEEHGQIGGKLKALATKKGLSLPTSMNGEAASRREDLSMTSGAELDQMYMRQAVLDHQKMIEAFEKQAAKGTDADLKKFAADTLPTLREHLKAAQATATKVGAGAK